MDYYVEAFFTTLSHLFQRREILALSMLIAPIYLRSMVVEKKELCGKMALADLLLSIIGI